MKTFILISTVISALFVSGCASNRGGTADDFETDGPTMDTPPADVDTGWSPRPDRTTGPVIPPP
jgi:hypothetical protein